MTAVLRLVFDDCLSKHAVEALNGFARFSHGQVEIAHLATLSLDGQSDDDWIPKIKEGWIVITTDRGKKITRGGKLPLVCRRNRVTHVMMTGSVHKLNTFDKLRALFEVWPDLIVAAASERGTGWKLQMTNSGRFALVFHTPPANEDEAPKTQQSLTIVDD